MSDSDTVTRTSVYWEIEEEVKEIEEKMEGRVSGASVGILLAQGGNH